MDTKIVFPLIKQVKTAILILTLLITGCAAKRSSALPQSFSGGVRRIAVLPFESSNPYIPGTVLSDIFTVQILQTDSSIQVIERKDLMKILQEQRLSLTGIVQPDKFSKLGSILGVDSILIGSVQTLETIQSGSGAISVTIKLMDVSSGRVLWADRQKIAHATWSVQEVSEIAEAIMEKAAKKMVQKMKTRLELETADAARSADDGSFVRQARASSDAR